MKKYRKKINQRKSSYCDLSKILVDINEDEVREYLNSDKDLVSDKDDYDYCFMLITSIAKRLKNINQKQLNI